MTSFKSDTTGFLTGDAMNGDNAEKLLADIKGDTSKIAAAMLSAGDGGDKRRSAPYPVGPYGHSRKALASALRDVVVATPGGRASRVLARGDGGRLGATPAGDPGTPQSKRMAEMAAATQALARTTEARRRDDKLDKRKPGAAPVPAPNGDDKGKGGKGAALLKKTGGAVVDAAAASQQRV